MKKSQNQHLEFTAHARERMRTRGISEREVAAVVHRGEHSIWRGDDLFEIKAPDDSLHGLVVITVACLGRVKTTFWRCAPGEEYREDRFWRVFGSAYSSGKRLKCTLGELLSASGEKMGGAQ